MGGRVVGTGGEVWFDDGSMEGPKRLTCVVSVDMPDRQPVEVEVVAVHRDRMTRAAWVGYDAMVEVLSGVDDSGCESIDLDDLVSACAVLGCTVARAYGLPQGAVADRIREILQATPRAEASAAVVPLRGMVS